MQIGKFALYLLSFFRNKGIFKMQKRILSILLALSLLLPLLPTRASAMGTKLDSLASALPVDEKMGADEEDLSEDEPLDDSLPDVAWVVAGSAEDSTPDFAKEPAFLVDASTSGSCGDTLSWTLDESGVLTIFGTGDMNNYTENLPAPWDAIKFRIRTVAFTGNVSSIGAQAFYSCYNLKSVSIPPSVTSIGNKAFYLSGLSETLYIPESVQEIGTYAFSYTALNEFRVAPDNPSYCSADGVLYDKSKSTLYFYPAKKAALSFVVPESVTLIYCTSFARATNLHDLYVYSPTVRAMTYTFFGDELTVWCKPSTRLYSQVSGGGLSGTLSLKSLPYCSVEVSSDKISVVLTDQFTDGNYFLAAYSIHNKLIGVQAVNGAETQTYAFPRASLIAEIRLFRLNREFQPVADAEKVWDSG